MKRLKLIMPLLLAVLALAACKETNTDRLEKMCGEWVSVGSKPPFTVLEENGQYMVQVQKKRFNGITRTETYLIRETEGYLFIETGFAVMLTYDKENDRIRLSPGGEYKRSNQSSKK